MTLNEIIVKIRSVSYVLGNVEVKGRSNLDTLLGSMQALDQIVKDLTVIADEFENPPDPDIRLDVSAEPKN